MDNIEIRTINGAERASFVENGSKERAWHRLGQVYDRPLTITEALEGCNADFEVTKQPIIAIPSHIVDLVHNGGMIDAKSLEKYLVGTHVATMRNDLNTTLGIVGKDYGVVQNADGFGFIDALCTGKQGEPCIESAGILGNGERIFVTAKFPEPIRLAHKSNDLVDMYIVFTTSHDGKGAVTAMVTPIRVVCNNTLNCAFRNNSGRWNIRHTSGVQDRLGNIAEASRALNLYDVYKTEFEDKMNMLSKVTLNDAQIKDVCARSLMSDEVYKVYLKVDKNLESEDLSTRVKNQMANLMECIELGIGQSTLENGTALKVYNGLTCYTNNYDRNKDDEKHFINLVKGSTYTRQQKCFDALMQFAV